MGGGGGETNLKQKIPRSARLSSLGRWTGNDIFLNDSLILNTSALSLSDKKKKHELCRLFPLNTLIL